MQCPVGQWCSLYPSRLSSERLEHWLCLQLLLSSCIRRLTAKTLSIGTEESNLLSSPSCDGGRALEWHGSFRSLPWASLGVVLMCLGSLGQLPEAKLTCQLRRPLTLSCARSIDTKTHAPLARNYNTASTHAITTKAHTELRYSLAPSQFSTACDKLSISFL